MRTASIKKREKYEKFLSSVEILKVLSSYEVSNLCDAVQREEFKPKEIIVTQGEEGLLNSFLLMLSC